MSHHSRPPGRHPRPILSLGAVLGIHRGSSGQGAFSEFPAAHGLQGALVLGAALVLQGLRLQAAGLIAHFWAASSVLRWLEKLVPSQ